MSLLQRISDMESVVTGTRAELTSRCQELSNITTDWTNKLNEIDTRHKEELIAERQKSLEVIS